MRKNTQFITILLLLTLMQAKSQCPINCQACTDTGVCIGCAVYYTLNEKGQCQPNSYIDGCLTYSTQTVGKSECLTCAKDRILMLGKCMRTTKNCQSLDQLLECKKCDEGYELVGRSCLSTNIGNCLLGHFPYKNYCRQYPLYGCRTKKQQHCQVCAQQYSLVNGACIPKNCSQQCQSCPCKGTVLFSTCLTCKPNNCLYSQNNLHCTLCQSSYTLINGQCYRPVKSDDINCNLVEEKTQVCTGCNHDYKLDRNNNCVRNFMIRDVKSCQDHKWMQLYETECYHRERYCEKIDSKTYQCQMCQDGFLIRAGRCERAQKCARMVGTHCVQCLADYYLTPKKQCEEKPKNCLNFNVDINQCVQCKSYTSLTFQTANKKPVCGYIEQSCISYNSEGYCIQCQAAFILKKRRCVRASANCQTTQTSDPTRCIACLVGFHLQNSLCYQNVKGCLKYGSNGNCSQCSKDSLLYNNRCIYVDKYCLQADETGNCMRCSQGLVPYGNKCVYYENFCASYGYDRMCNQPFSWFEMKSDVSSQSKQEYRLFILSANQAKPAYSLASDRKVKNLADSKGFYSENGIIHFYPTLSIWTKAIKSIGADYLILECREQYTLRSGLCVKKQQLVDNCKEYSIVTSECILCEKGYDMNSNSKCEIRSEKSCADKDLGKDNCLKCNSLNGYFNAGGWCVNKLAYKNRDAFHFEVSEIKIMWPLLPNCDQQSIMGKCQICKDGYLNRQGKCILHQQYCDSYHPLGFCQKCANGYSFEGGNCIPSNCDQKCLSCKTGFQYQSGKCFPQKQPNCAIYSNSQCIVCQPQYFLNPANRKCQSSLPNCATMNETSLQCIQCNQQYTLYRDRCVLQIANCNDYSLDGKCLKCQSNSSAAYQLMNDSTCMRVPARCARLGKFGFCELCETGYGMMKGGWECVVLRENCRTYDQTGRCSACAGSYTLRNGVCQYTLTIPNCRQVNPTTNKCDRCSQNYQVNDGVCALIDVNCQQYRNGFCSTCVRGYFLGANGCEAMPLYCQSYNYKQKRCEHCVSRYMLAEGKCIPKSIILNGCINQTQDQPTCVACQTGFKIKDGLCYAHNCLTFSAQRNCVECPTYYRKSGADRRICEPHFCKTYSKGPSCDSFQPNYIGGFIIQEYGRITIQYCKDYHPSTHNCVKCQKYRSHELNSQLKYAICLPLNCVNSSQINCTKCKDGFVKAELGTCVAQHCITFNEVGLCQICQPQYLINPNTNLCEQGTKFCLEFDNNKNCTKCSSGYALNNRKNCVSQIKGCRNYGASQCFVCNKGLEYKEGACKVSNCANFKQKEVTACDKCKVGYELTREGLCRTSNCELFSEQGWSCNGCFGRYTLSQGLCQPRNCAMLSVVDQITCLLCEQNFDLVDGGCLHKNCINPRDTSCTNCIEGWLPDYRRLCIVRDCLDNDFKTGACTTCKSGKRLLNGLCVRDRCLSRLSNIINQCTLCESSFYLANQRQYCVAYFCKDWDKSNGQCLECASNFSLQSGRCVNNLCTKFDNSNPLMPSCSSCPQGYNPFSQYCVPDKCEKEHYSPLTAQCQKCIFGYEPVDGICKLSNCRDYKQNVSDFSVCLNCQLGFWNQAGLCLPLNCQQFLPSTTKCTKCNIGFYLYSDICLAIYCQVFSDQGQCTKCQPLYKLTTESTCTRSHCLEDGLDACLKCEDGYEVNQHTGGFCQPVNCERIDQETNSCRECWAGFYKDQGICKDLHCQQFSSAFDCKKCRLGFTFSSKELCQLAYPNFCPFGQYYSEAKQICEKISIPNCKYSLYNEPNVCIDCMQNYFLRNGFCYSFKGCTRHSYMSGCHECESEYKLVDGRCVGLKEAAIEKDVGCEIGGSNGECQICRKGFVRSGSRCVGGRQNCLEVNDRGGCTKCKDKYHVRFDGLCYQNGQYCEQANLMGHCQKCSIGYQLNSSLCVKQQIAPLVKVLTKSETVKKEEVSTVQAQKVGLKQEQSRVGSVGSVEDHHISYIDNCLFQDDIKQVCIICNSEYYITARGKCLAMPDNCKFVNMQGVCFYCEDGFELSKNTCVQSKAGTKKSESDKNSQQLNDLSKVAKTTDNLRNQWKV